MRAWLGLCLLLALPRPAVACGLTPPIGPNGLPTMCHGDEHAVRVRAGVVLGGTSTRIDFGGESSPLVQGAASATIDVLPFERLSLSAALGAALPGRLDYRGQRYELRPGPLFGVGVGYRFLGGKAPFVHTSLTLSWARSSAVAPDESTSTVTFKDYRLGVAIGKTFGGVVAPFVMARYFGAGTEWDVAGHGADHYRYHVGVGAALALSEHFDALAELAFLGEKRASLGVGYAF